MNGTESYASTHPSGEETRTRTIVGGSALESSGAIATIALAIAGLARIWPTTMAAVATIVAGAAVVAEGGLFGLKYGQMQAGALTEGAVGAEFMGGMSAVILGILAILGVASGTLISVAVLALGATFLFAGRVFTGLAVSVLGILAIVGLSQPTLILVAFLVLGADLLLRGSEHAVRTLTSPPR